MRICLASIHPRMLSGQIDSLVGLARELGRLGHGVHVISPSRSPSLLEVDRTRLTDEDGGTLLGKVGRIARTFSAIRAAAAGADIVHLNLPTPAFAILGDLLQSQIEIPVVVGFEAHLLRFGDGLRPARLLAAPQFYVPRLLVNNHLTARIARHRAAAYIVSSKLQRRELIDVGVPPGRVHVLPNLFDAGKLAVEGSRDAAIGMATGRLVTYIGHYNDVKGVDLLVEAFPHVLAAHPEARLVLAWSGLGPAGPIDRAIQRAGIADAVIRLGRVNVGRLLEASSAVVLPYRMTIGQAAFPGVVLETMRVGVPLVTTNLPLLAELLVDGVHALLAPPEHPAAIAQAVNQLLEQDELANAMRTAQRRLIQDRLNPRRLAEGYVSLYQQTVQRQAAVLQPGRDCARI